ncbi:alanyl-tRNA editing protein [Anianabacter salinae]|uniref:alanyl-tRNA editing protein n=1 Tax=Anianabacter salinae TaxID=2851023 RepID=UPI00225DCFCC|nr:alanyl-tRNA editing protein [Anianabacter salinae]MBV0912199.1 alanyl-tRNA editing protein [Anianabacter salinae]
MTEMLFRTDPYLKEATALVTAITDEGGIVLDRTVFYPAGGGQPGDIGRLSWGSEAMGDTGGGDSLTIRDTVKGDGDQIILVPDAASGLPEIGTEVTQHLAWDRRHRHMRIHTALHLLSVVIPLPVTGGSISAEKGRLDFDMPEAPGDKDALETALNEMIGRDLPVTEDWITEDQLDANPGLVKTMSVQPPRGAGIIRLIRIGEGEDQVDLQPCGGTHVARTGEIGTVRIGKIEKKGKQNRRVSITLAG